MINRQTFTIPFKLPSLNDYINACRTNPHVGATVKKNVERDIAWEIKAAKLTPVINKAVVCMTFVEGNKRRDVDNVMSGAKFCLDALVSSGVLLGDSPKHVIAAPAFVTYGEGARVIVELIDGNPDELHALVKNARAAYEVGE